MIVSEGVSIKDGSNLFETFSLIGIGLLGFHGFSFRLCSGLFETIGISNDLLLKAGQLVVRRALPNRLGSRRGCRLSSRDLPNRLGSRRGCRLGNRCRCRLGFSDGSRLGSRRRSKSIDAAVAIANVLRSKVKALPSLLKLFLKLIDRLHCSFLLGVVLRFRLRCWCGCGCFFSFNWLAIGTIRARVSIGRTGSTIGKTRSLSGTGSTIGRAGTTKERRSGFCWARATIEARSRSAVGSTKSL